MVPIIDVVIFNSNNNIIDKYLAFGALNTLSIFCRKDTSQSLKRRRTSIVNEPFQSAKRESFTKAAFAITQQCETIAKARENESESYESSADELSPPRTKTIYSQAAGENEEDYCDSYSMRLEKVFQKAYFTLKIQ